MEVVCRWDGLACLVDTPCFTFIKGGQAVVTCVRYKGDIDSEYEKRHFDSGGLDC